jgi:hypothetical protein
MTGVSPMHVRQAYRLITAIINGWEIVKMYADAGDNHDDRLRIRSMYRLDADAKRKMTALVDAGAFIDLGPEYVPEHRYLLNTDALDKVALIAKRFDMDIKPVWKNYGSAEMIQAEHKSAKCLESCYRCKRSWPEIIVQQGPKNPVHMYLALGGTPCETTHVFICNNCNNQINPL